MTPESTRKFNTTIGSLFIAVGLLGWSVALYKTIVPAPPVSYEAPPPALVDARSCASTLTEIGFRAVVANGEVSAFLLESAEVLEGNSTKTPRDLLESATLAVSACKMSVKSFCMGGAEGCPGEPGLSMTLHNATARDEVKSPAAVKGKGSGSAKAQTAATK